MLRFEGVIFDLDGVLLSTDGLHYEAWKKMADREGIEFNAAINERLRGVSRLASLDIVLERARRPYSEQEKAAMHQRQEAQVFGTSGRRRAGCPRGWARAAGS